MLLVGSLIAGVMSSEDDSTTVATPPHPAPVTPISPASSPAPAESATEVLIKEEAEGSTARLSSLTEEITTAAPLEASSEGPVEQTTITEENEGRPVEPALVTVDTAVSPQEDNLSLTTSSPVSNDDLAEGSSAPVEEDLDEASTEIIAKNLRTNVPEPSVIDTLDSRSDDELAGLMSREVLNMDIMKETHLENSPELNRKTRQFGNQQFALQQQNQFFNAQQFQNQGQVNQRFTSPGFQNRAPAGSSSQLGGQFGNQFGNQFQAQPQQQQAAQAVQPQLGGQFGSQPQLQAGQLTQQLGQALFGQNSLPSISPQQQQLNNNFPSAFSGQQPTFQTFQQATPPQLQQSSPQPFQPAATEGQFQRTAGGSIFQPSSQQFQSSASDNLQFQRTAAGSAFQPSSSVQPLQQSSQQFSSFPSSLSPLQSFQDLSGSLQQQQQATTRTAFPSPTPTPAPSFRSFPSQEDSSVRIRPIGTPTPASKGFTLDGFDLTGLDLGNLLGTAGDFPAAADDVDEEEEQPQVARPANVRPPPNADPRQKGASGRTAPAVKSQVSDVSISPTKQEDIVAPSGPIHQLWNQLFSGETVSRILEQEQPSRQAPNSDSLQIIPDAARAVATSRRKPPTTALPQVVRPQPSPAVLTTFRPDEDADLEVPSRFNAAETPNFANFPAKVEDEEAVDSNSFGNPAVGPAASKSRKRMRIKKKPRTEATTKPLAEADFVPTPPSSGKRARLLAASTTAAPLADSDFIPTPPPTKRSKNQSKSSSSKASVADPAASARSSQQLTAAVSSTPQRESSRSSGGRGSEGNLIDLQELAGVQELQEALRNKNEELRRLDQAKTQEIRKGHIPCVLLVEEIRVRRLDDRLIFFWWSSPGRIQL